MSTLLNHGTIADDNTNTQRIGVVFSVNDTYNKSILYNRA